MSPDAEKIPVATNGKGPHPGDATSPADEPSAAVADTEGPAPASTLAFTPTQLAVGFGILASLALLLVGRMRRRRGGRGPLGLG